jgi:uridine kinase
VTELKIAGEHPALVGICTASSSGKMTNVQRNSNDFHRAKRSSKVCSDLSYKKEQEFYATRE